ncbi:hypothetical protein [Paenibacillus crassostreae]|uniref:Uncharacterized protein n=1 Tax=Paenibacillus crassostreae TaxID=1763538 RepID=A0A167FE77_9BACL|nr:hypothetical protein [Paenibacillus crassostreae]AOZ90775.1 hypothetical protein LPB68_00190 [Paenibacillus crassostreae]OAB76458.1 hypothetical protein PNBC_03340 [Paenibacillus crassostreae]
MYLNGYKYIFIKIIAAIVSTIAFTLYGSWKTYTPLSERLYNVGYNSFSGLFAFNFVPFFFIFIILGVILSPMIDSIILSKFNIKGIKGILIIVLSYLFLGVISGIIISAFFFRLDGIINYISISIIGAMIFLFFQTLFQFLLFKLGSKQK